MGLNCHTFCVCALMLQFSVYCISKSGGLFNPHAYTHNVEDLEKEHLTNSLGMTYDIISGNPVGDPLYTVDLGYRRYVLKDSLRTNKDEHTDENVNHSEKIDEKDNQNSVSYSAYKRAGIKCSNHHETKIINGLDDINEEYKSYEFPSQYDIHPFNASNYYKMLVRRINRGESILVQKDICSKYFVYLDEVKENMLDSFFLNMLRELGENYQSIGGDKYKCDLQFYRNNKYNENCLKTVTPWMTFFYLYGTHLISGVYYGGKVVNNLYIENDDIKSGDIKSGDIKSGDIKSGGIKSGDIKSGDIKSGGIKSGDIKSGRQKIRLYKKRMDPFNSTNNNTKNGGSLYFGSVITNEKIIHIAERNLMIDGGGEEDDNYGKKNTIKNSYKKWKNSISGKFAKPVKLILVPFADFIKSNDGKNAYYKALEFYSNLTYSNYNPYPFQLNKTEEDMYKMHIKKWNQYIDKNVNFNIFPKCKKGEKILSGFIITNKKKRYDNYDMMHMCPLSEECSSGINIESDKSFEFGWILCSRENVNEIHQIKKLVHGSKGVITCPTEMKIGFGFSLTMQKGIHANMTIEPCKSNVESCALDTKTSENSESFLWINCLPNKKKLLLQSLESKTFSEKMYLNDNTLVSLKCSKGNFIIAGFAVDYTSSNMEDYLICPLGSSTCDLKIRVNELKNQEMHFPIIYIVCSSL
ncbi:perforin-like protein 5 [Plasmodium gonderi]|uniref:Perforin-like protein 5 n=1 Tax=Plasmodium gonderi TaxID=77519 RepID=A0A1Y1JGZ3_PLAGO|nr:perforin-like protein 5 [Plasmodium gonderi]GAW79713.1 perforin-like protein 5 [Plasmodium gonderi]